MRNISRRPRAPRLVLAQQVPAAQRSSLRCTCLVAREPAFLILLATLLWSGDTPGTTRSNTNSRTARRRSCQRRRSRIHRFSPHSSSALRVTAGAKGSLEPVIDATRPGRASRRPSSKAVTYVLASANHCQEFCPLRIFWWTFCSGQMLAGWD
jgi:hypothetical protein